MAGLGRPGPGPRAALPAWKREVLERRRAKLAALGAGAEAATPERLVLADSLGPLRENPFMRLESERRRGARRGAAAARPVQQLLELYRRVPGVRTIRADNILIIESAPGLAPEPGPDPGPPPAARVRAAEVLVYEAPSPPGRVSRLLQKFDPPPASRPRGSPERSRPQPSAGPGPGPGPGPAGSRAADGEPERRGAGPRARRSDFLQKTGSNSFTVHPRGLPGGAGACPLPNGPAAPDARAGAANGPADSAPRAPGPAQWKPKVESGAPPLHPPSSPRSPGATPAAPPALPAPSPASATPSQRQRVSAATSANDSFEIRPAAKPDPDSIPAGDLQARALASLRANSRNSFLFIPKRKNTPGPPQRRPLEGLPQGQGGWASQRLQGEAQQRPGVEASPAPQRNALGAEEGAGPRPTAALLDRASRWPRPPSPPLSPRAAAEAETAQGSGAPGLRNSGEPRRPGLPVTFIDEVDSEEEAPQEAKLPCSGVSAPRQDHPHPAGPGPLLELLRRGSHTFVVVPKGKPGSLQANGGPQPQEAAAEEGGSLPGTPAAPLKKRYPAVHEIEVIGGYLALQRSCLSKAGASRKKMKISFNDKSLHTTFEYPSESSLAREEGPEEDEDSAGGAPDGRFELFLPRATFVSSEGPRRPDSSACLSSYTPKHAVAFGQWQEQTQEPLLTEAEPKPREVMLTPASQSDLSDFRSEPALYF
ncbi:Taperin [Galemys pyrenaicus]|uniref:Taperin n=1 Tax=Galemys pyrenaicus TaxID=202257 RepID=A0A8J6DQZ1_GALPY|nr:Taperin [Galemys pyrenaicus]